MNAVRPRELLRDLEAGVSTAYDEDRSFGHSAGVPVTGAVHLEHLGPEPGGERRYAGHLERPGCDDDLLCLDLSLRALENERSVLAAERLDGAFQLDRELEFRRILLEVSDHLIPCRIALGVARERQSGKAVVPAGREQGQRVPAPAPRGTDRLATFED